MGTSLPELVVTIISSLSGNSDIIIGNIIGSNLLNLLFILGVISFIKPIKFEQSTIKQILPLLIIVTLLVLVMGIGITNKSKLIITRSESILLLAISLIYFLYPIITYYKEKSKNKNKKTNKLESRFIKLQKSDSSFIKYIIYILLGGFALKYGGDFVVDSASSIAYLFNISERIVSLTIISLGTSLPELVTSIVAIIKGDDDISEGNIIGSCIINLCLILGTGSIISNIYLTSQYIENLILLLGTSILIWLYSICNKNNTLERNNGIILFIIYIIYCLKLFI